MTWLPGKVNVVFFIVVSQTYLVAQITVEQISLNLVNEINSLKVKSFKFCGDRSIFVKTERQFAKLNTTVRKFACTSPNQSFKINFSYSAESENNIHIQNQELYSHF